jgi:hypothetical protein
MQGLSKAGRGDHDEQGVARQLLPGRNSGELAHDESEIALDRSEVGERLAASRLASPFGTCATFGVTK